MDEKRCFFSSVDCRVLFDGLWGNTQEQFMVETVEFFVWLELPKPSRHVKQWEIKPQSGMSRWISKIFQRK